MTARKDYKSPMRSIFGPKKAIQDHIQGGDMKLSVNFEPAYLFNQFEFCHQKLQKTYTSMCYTTFIKKLVVKKSTPKAARCYNNKIT